jgi:hypothetical protein
MSDMDLTQPIQTTLLQGENLCIYRKKTPAVKLGEEKPYKPPQ